MPLQPYLDAAQLIAVPLASKFTRFEALNSLRVAMQSGTTGVDAVLADNGIIAHY